MTKANDIINRVIDWFLPSLPDRIPSPIVIKKTFVKNQIVEPDEGIEDVKWGDVIEKTIVTRQQHGYEWDRSDPNAKKLSTQDLDDYDTEELTHANVNPEYYIQVKPYVIAGRTNGEIAILIDRSLSWVERVSPAVRRAHERRLNPPLPLK